MSECMLTLAHPTSHPPLPPPHPSIQDINTDASKTHFNSANHITHLSIGEFESQFLLPAAYSNPVG